MQTSVIQKVIGLMTEKGLNASQLAKEIGMEQKTVSNYLNGSRKPSLEFVDLIARTFVLDYNWLLSYTSKEFKEDGIFPAKPFIESSYAECGKPGGFSMCVKKEDCKTLSIPFFKDYDFSIIASGDSMVNRTDPNRSINSGDIVGCKLVQSRTHVRFGEVYALSTLDGFTIKKVVPSETEGCIKCVPFNSEDNFYPFDIPTEEIYDWAFVVGVARISKW